MSKGGLNGVVDSKRIVKRTEAREYHNFKINFNAYQTNKYYESGGGRGFSAISIFTVVFVVLFVVNYFYASVGYEQTFTFSHLLEKLSSIEPVGIDWIRNFSEMSITEDWSVFNWFRDFLNNFVMKIVTAFLFLCTGLVELLRYCYFFVGILFGW